MVIICVFKGLDRVNRINVTTCKKNYISSLNSNLDEVKPAEKNLLCSHWLLTLHRRGGGLFDILASFRLGLLFCTLRNGSKLLVHFP